MEISMSLACKLGSIVVHVEELIETGHPFDAEAAKALISDPEVYEWLTLMDGQGLLPKKRSES